MTDLWLLPDQLVIVGDEAYARADWEHKLSGLERKREYMRVYRQRRSGQIGALHELRCRGPHRGNKACHPIPMYSEELSR